MSETPLPGEQEKDPSRWTETEDQVNDRHWAEILQELRVTQTGTQILTGFLLTLAFQARFADLTAVQRDIYLALVIVAALTTALALAPVSLHRVLFRQGVKARIVTIGDVILRIVLGGVAATLTGTVLLIFSVVAGPAPAIVAAAATLVLIVSVWVVLPHRFHPRRRR